MRIIIAATMLLLLFGTTSTTNAQECLSDMYGNGNFQNKCRFPFAYRGQSFNACTMVDHDVPWCRHRNGVTWGECSRACFEPPPRPPPTPLPVRPPPTPSPTEGIPTDPPRPTEAPSPNPTRRPTPEPTLNPTQRPTPEPTNFPTTSPSAFPTGYPTSSPSVQPTPEPTLVPTEYPTAPTGAPTQDLSLQMQLTPFVLDLYVFSRRLYQQDDETTLFPLVEELQELATVHLLETYQAVLGEMQSAWKVELVLVEEEPPPDEVAAQVSVSYQILGTVSFAKQPVPNQDDLDLVTQGTLERAEFVHLLQSADHVILAETQLTDTRDVVSSSKQEGHQEQSQGTTFSQSNVGFVFGVVAAMLCGMGVVVLSLYLLRMYCRNDKEPDPKEGPQLLPESSPCSSSRIMPLTPMTRIEESYKEHNDDVLSSDDEQTEARGNIGGDGESSIYSYRMDNSSFADGASLDYSYTYSAAADWRVCVKHTHTHAHAHKFKRAYMKTYT